MENQPKALKVYFEVTNVCNFACDFCPSNDSVRQKQHMDPALFQKGIDDVVAGNVAGTVGFHILGEPLLYPGIYDAIRYARSKGLRTEINTNGSLLTESRVQHLAAAGLDGLYISLQTVDEEDHASRGSHLSFAEYYQRILTAVHLAREARPEMDLTICFMNASTRKFFDIDKLIRMDGSNGAHPEKLLSLILDLCTATGQSASRAEVTAALRRLNVTDPTNIRLDGHLTVFAQPLADWGNAFTSRRVHPARIGYCGYALSNVGVLNSGQVTICCVDYDGKTSLGNLHDASLSSLLSSAQAEALRDGFKKLRLVHPHCQRCMGSPSRLKAIFKGLASVYLFKLLGFQPGRVKELALARS